MSPASRPPAYLRQRQCTFGTPSLEPPRTAVPRLIAGGVSSAPRPKTAPKHDRGEGGPQCRRAGPSPPCRPPSLSYPSLSPSLFCIMCTNYGLVHCIVYNPIVQLIKEYFYSKQEIRRHNAMKKKKENSLVKTILPTRNKFFKKFRCDVSRIVRIIRQQ